MTYLLIHHKVQKRRDHLLKMAEELMSRQYNSISDLLSDPDIHYIDHPQHVSIKLDEVKALLKEIVYKPFSGNQQLAVIFHAHMLTVEAQNALLKSLEEQTDATSFLLLVNNENSVLPTIVSRSNKVYVMDDPDKEDILEDLPISPLLDLSLIDQFNEIEKLVESDKEEKGVIKTALSSLLQQLRVELQESIAHGPEEMKIVNDQIKTVIVASERYDANVNKKLLLENMCLQLHRIRDRKG